VSRWPFPGRAAAAPPGPTIDSLAREMPERKGVLWAVESSKLVKSKTTPVDQQATEAAEAWAKDPTPANHAAAAAAVKKTDHQGPGAWAAQAAAWSHPTGNPSPTALAVKSGSAPHAAPGAPNPAVSLVSVAVAGSVALAAALFAGAKPPAPQQPAAPQALGPPNAPGKLAVPPMPAVPQPPAAPGPAELAKIAKVHKAFIDLGQKILADKHAV
jgi:hypothetical protein